MKDELDNGDGCWREKVRSWFLAHPSPTYKDLFNEGYAVPTWPAPWGLGASPEVAAIIDQETIRAGILPPHAENTAAIGSCAKALLTFGTEWQRQRYLEPALSCEEHWCMLFSEPACGSDLAALQTSAVRDGDHYIVNGHKIWSSGAHLAQVGILMARTKPSEPKHKGLSQFIIEMDMPGITIRPIADMTGDCHFNEVFFDDVRVPVANMVGEDGQGWAVVNYQLQTERTHLGRPGVIFGSGPTARELVIGLNSLGKLDDPLIQDRAARLFVEGEVLRVMALRALNEQSNGQQLTAASALHKMLAGPHGQRFVQLAKETQGLEGLVHGARPFAPGVADGEHGRSWVMDFSDWDHCFWFSPSATIGGGAQEILKTVVAERVIGMPRDVGPR